MDVLIKNFDMPKNCGECQFYKKVFGFPDCEHVCAVTKKGMVWDAWIRFYKERYKDCPLVPVRKEQTADSEMSGRDMQA